MNLWKGYYINLDSDTDKRTKLERVLIQYGLRPFYSRFPAINGQQLTDSLFPGLSPGEKGCWMSHIELIRNLQNFNCHIHVIEDDFLPASSFGHKISALFSTMEPNSWDILITEYFVSPVSTLFHEFRKLYLSWRETGQFYILNLNPIKFATALHILLINIVLTKC